MVTVYVGGEKIGASAELDTILAGLAAGREAEFRDDSGKPLGRFLPTPAANEPPIPWEPTVTLEDISCRATEPGITTDELRRRLGWQ